ncbi:MAG: STAS domain-containing protein [Anaerolineales bacterium]
MHIQIDPANPLTPIILQGRLDATQAEYMSHTLRQAAEASPHLILNMAEVDFIDSSGLAALVQVMKYCRQGGGDLLLCHLQDNPRIIFDLTRLDKAFRIFDDCDQAVRALQES